MLRYSLVLLAGFWVVGSAGAATWADGLFDELNKDFGSVPRGPTMVHRFRVHNNLGAAVNITGVRVSCGCVSATVLKSLLNPGEETSVVARMDTSRFMGPRTVTIYITFDRPAVEEVRLWVQADARNDFNLAPDTLTFGQIKRGSTPAAATQITFYGHAGAAILSAKGESNYIQPTFKEVRRLDTEVTYELTTSLRGDTPVGKWYTDVWVRTNIPEMPQVRVPLTVEVESALTVNPEPVSLGKVKLNTEVERRVIVRGVKPFKITKIQGVDDQLSVRDSTAGSKEVHVLTVKVKPEKSGNLSRKVKVLTDLKDDNQIDFFVNGFVADD